MNTLTERFARADEYLTRAQAELERATKDRNMLKQAVILEAGKTIVAKLTPHQCTCLKDRTQWSKLVRCGMAEVLTPGYRARNNGRGIKAHDVPATYMLTTDGRAALAYLETPEPDQILLCARVWYRSVP